MNFNHKTVLINETILSLDINENGIYIDGTAGGGGLSFEIASKLCKNGKLICIDRDPDAIKICKERLEKFENVEIICEKFSNMLNIVKNLNIEKVDGIVLDLGVSSYQLDEAERGFSYHNDAPLDMRMSKSGKSAYDIVNSMKFDELKNIIFKYGEEKFASKIAKSIVKKREISPIKTTLELAEIIKNCVPYSVKRNSGHPARKTFQAIRIFVNKELEELELALKSSLKILKPNGIISIITFHSLEDRIVKQNMKIWSKGCICPPDFPVCTCNKKPEIEIISKKPIIPSEIEVNSNFRSRSAKLRVYRKI